MKKLYLSTLALFLITIIAFFSFLLLSSQNNKNIDADNTNKKNLVNNNINKEAEAEEEIYDPLPEKIYHINGEIRKITEDMIFVEAMILDGKRLKPGEERDTEIIKVEINAKTKITTLTFEPKDETKKSYRSVVKNISFNDLKIHDRIEALASSNVKGLKNFVATSIQILPRSIQ